MYWAWNIQDWCQSISPDWNMNHISFSYERWKPRNEQLAKMRSFHQSKRSDNKRYTVEVRWGIFFWEFDVFFLFLRAVVNMPIQTLIIPPWLLLCKMIIPQLELGSPVVWCTRFSFVGLNHTRNFHFFFQYYLSITYIAIGHYFKSISTLTNTKLQEMWEIRK